MKNIFIAIILLFTASAMAAENYDLNHRFGLGVAAGLGIPAGGTAFKNSSNTGWSASLNANYFFTSQWGINVVYDHAKLGSKGKTLAQGFSVDALYRFCKDSRLNPYAGLGAGAGGTSESVLAQFDAGSFNANAKVGVDYALNQDWYLNLTAKYLLFFNENDGGYNEHVILPQVGITYYFDTHNGKTTETSPQATKSSEKKWVDTDGDGVSDDQDQCPNTPKGTKVNSLGCAAEEKVEFTLNVQFDNGKSVVKPQYDADLRKVADLLKAHPDMGGEVQGHTDNTGKEALNLTISDARAKAVKRYLSDKLGVEWNRLTGMGYGSSKPIADNATAEGRSKNRRVVLVLQSMDTIKALKAKKKSAEQKAKQ